MIHKTKAQKKIQKEMANWDKHLQLQETGGKNNNPTEKWLNDMNRDHRFKKFKWPLNL